MIKFLASLLLSTAVYASEDREAFLLQRANANIAIATVCWEERNMECFEGYLFSAILKLDSIDGVNTTAYVLERVTRDMAWDIIDAFNRPYTPVTP